MWPRLATPSHREKPARTSLGVVSGRESGRALDQRSGARGRREEATSVGVMVSADKVKRPIMTTRGVVCGSSARPSAGKNRRGDRYAHAMRHVQANLSRLPSFAPCLHSRLSMYGPVGIAKSTPSALTEKKWQIIAAE